jgi:hypothetical protein
MFCTNPDVNGAPAIGARAMWPVWYVESALAGVTHKHDTTAMTNVQDPKCASLIVAPVFGRSLTLENRPLARSGKALVTRRLSLSLDYSTTTERNP